MKNLDSKTCGASATGWNVYRFTGEGQVFIGSRENDFDAFELAEPGDQIQHGLDGAVENVGAR